MEASLRELNVKASELARRAQEGETIVITDRGRPIADLGPHRQGVTFAHRRDVVSTFASLPTVDPDRFRADLAAVADEYRNPYER